MLWEHPVHGQMAKNGALSENHALSQAARAEGGWMKGPVTTVVRAGARGTLSSHMLHRCLGSQGAARPEQLAESPQVLGTPLSDAEPDSGCARHRATWLSIDSCENTVDALHTMRSSPWPWGPVLHGPCGGTWVETVHSAAMPVTVAGTCLLW